MRILYIADDGTEFNDEMDCEMYEMRQAHPHCNTIQYFDETGKPIIIGKDVKDAFDDNIYYQAWKVIIHNEDEFKDFCWLREDYCGWCEMEDITGPGIWTYVGDPFTRIKFVKVEE